MNGKNVIIPQCFCFLMNHNKANWAVTCYAADYCEAPLVGYVCHKGAHLH